MCRVSARVSTPAMPTMPCFFRYSSSEAVDRQLLTTGESSRTTKPARKGRSASGSSSLTPVLPICGAVMVTICPQ